MEKNYLIGGAIAFGIALLFLWWRRRKRSVKVEHLPREDIGIGSRALSSTPLHQRPPLERLVPSHELDKEEDRIVGIAEPKGFWSRLVMGQRQDQIMAMFAASQGANANKGFWQNLIHAQRTIAGKFKGSGRE